MTGRGVPGTGRVRGFTLIEMATVMAIIALLLGALLVPLSTQMNAGRYERARAQIETAKEALVGFAIANGNRLPCPDNDTDGLADPVGGGTCTAVEGFLPYASLGVQPLDPWGNRLRYRPYPAFTGTTGLPPLEWNLAVPPWTTPGLIVQDRSPPPAGPLKLTADKPGAPAAIVFSCGKNGIADAANNGDDSLAATANCGTPASPLDVIYNQDVFVEDVFDDLLDWLSTPLLVARLVSAGTWPR